MRLFRSVALATVALATSLALHSNAASAAGREMVQFFESLDGSWEGTGARAMLQADGTRLRQDTVVLVTIDRDRGDTWNTTSETTINGLSEFGQLTFSVRGDSLFVGNGTTMEPVAVIESSPTRLVYRMQRVDVTTGRLYEFNYHYERAGEKTLRGRNTLTLNGVMIGEETFELDRF